MAQKIKPNSFRLGITLPWSSRWFPKRSLRFFLEEDHLVRQIVKEKILAAGIHSVEIERTGDDLKIIIKASRPGLIIGRGGKGIEELKEAVLKALGALRRKNKIVKKFSLNLNIEELKRSEISAAVEAQQIAFDIEKRLPYRRVMKRHLDTLMQNREIKGAKIKLSGRLNGAEISRTDWLANGRMPLQTLRAVIDYGEATAFNSYGTVGVKVWLYKGEVFEEKKENKR
ncbi:MAG: 30S ribosomal protein S3 [Candidatus Jorgensenbacteria bacterium GW2011_GWA1_48_11]|uniref:Small ribosomal subunit protein uS3 n=2 Tax=root TaxID=1 RepID=A0A0G1U9R3_9BACT|nr:30S ribosomal protein S3 [uncultured organism]KKU90906.1 MAG: 30S ribosomal protein S3 [Candidatus Jorgensenbacteria bacterium GW2011_GWA1_48_11]KKW12362.1 MAG: 30S ribosomal protein S3 [Candidatus Jorgensenbacteria bacterium GW2011_GWB1_49_9]